MFASFSVHKRVRLDDWCLCPRHYYLYFYHEYNGYHQQSDAHVVGEGGPIGDRNLDGKKIFL